MVVAGAVCMGIGAMNLAVGSAVLDDAPPVHGEYDVFDEELIGRALVLNGAIFATIGVPLFIAGLWPIEVREPTEKTVAPPPATAQLQVGARRADLRVTF